MSAAMIPEAPRADKQKPAGFSLKTSENEGQTGCEKAGITTRPPQSKERTKIFAREWRPLANVTCCVRTDW
jgi:hypothetical protein